MDAVNTLKTFIHMESSAEKELNRLFEIEKGNKH